MVLHESNVTQFCPVKCLLMSSGLLMSSNFGVEFCYCYNSKTGHKFIIEFEFINMFLILSVNFCGFLFLFFYRQSRRVTNTT